MKNSLLSLVFGFMLAALAAELLLHAFPVSTGYNLTSVDAGHPMVHGGPFFPYTYSRDWSFHLENSGVLNNYGFRASHDYVPDSRALVLIGNSFIQADALRPPETITERLAALLHRPSYGIGADGFSLADYLEATRWATATFDSRTVLILLTTGDLSHSCTERSGAHYLKFADGTITMALVNRDSTPLKRRLNESKLFRYVYDNLRAAANWSKGWRRDRDEEGPPNPEALAGRLGCTDERFKSAATRFLLDSFHEIENARHARVMFLLAPGYRLEQMVAAGGIRDVDVFAQRASLDGFEVIPLASAFSAALSAGTRLDFLPIDGHWNAAAHAIAAATAAPIIEPGACLTNPREPRWLGEGADARRAAPAVAGPTVKPRNAADAPLPANPKGPGRFRFIRRCRLLIGSRPNHVGSASPEAKSATVAATWISQTGS